MSQLIINPSRSFTQLVHTRDLSGEMETVAIEDVGDKRIFHYAQRTGDITNSNEIRRKEEDMTKKTGDLMQVASVPMVVWNLWENMGITANQRELRKAIKRHKNEYMVTNKQID